MDIKYVAVYLRKSRGEADNDLEKHKKVLTELCIENNWKYVEYAEIGSGDTIEMRPVFQSLLKDIENNVYDAVCVVDIDRLGRGDMGEQDRIKKVFSASNTYVVTPQQVYNLNDDDDEFVVDMKSFIARREYKQIVKRLTQGKKVGARMGMWTNGTPPYPYEYEKWGDKYNKKGLVVNDEKLAVYRFIVDSVVNNHMTPTQIAWELNRQQVPSSRGSIWHGETVSRLLKDETHLGKIISNKTSGDGHRIKKQGAKPQTNIPRSEWVVVENCHEKVKTIEEHQEILKFAARLTKFPRRKPEITTPLSGLIKCAICGHTMSVYYRENRGMKETIKPCWYRDGYGNKCPNRGSTAQVIYDYLNADILKYKHELVQHLKSEDVNEILKDLNDKKHTISADIKKKEQAIKRVLDAFENGVYDLVELKERKLRIDNSLADLRDNLGIIESEISKASTKTLADRVGVIEEFERLLTNQDADPLELHEIYCTIIDSVVWVRTGDDISIEVNYK